MRIQLNKDVAGEGYEPEGFFCMPSSLGEPDSQKNGLNLQLVPLGVCPLL